MNRPRRCQSRLPGSMGLATARGGPARGYWTAGLLLARAGHGVLWGCLYKGRSAWGIQGWAQGSGYRVSSQHSGLDMGGGLSRLTPLAPQSLKILPCTDFYFFKTHLSFEWPVLSRRRVPPSSLPSPARRVRGGRLVGCAGAA